jgi:hypothetical protein
MRVWSLAAGNTSGRIASRAATSGVEATVWSLSGGRTGAGRGARANRFDSEFVEHAEHLCGYAIGHARKRPQAMGGER